jgi:hypothetical protein
MEPFFLIPLVLIAALVARLIAGAWDGTRIQLYIERDGGELISRNWNPFGPGWWGNNSDRIYQIRYRDREGCVHEAHVKTSVLSGVYLTEDRIIRGAPLTSVEEEKARLRKRLAELEREGD